MGKAYGGKDVTRKMSNDTGRPRILLLLITVVSIAVVLYYGLVYESGQDEPDQEPNWSNSAPNDDANRDSPVNEGQTDEYYGARLAMVRNQMQSRDVTDPDVLEAMRRVPRHEFVPSAQKSNAYEDHPLPIGHGQTISQPYIVAIMTEMLDLEAGKSRALEVGTGSGYQAAILGEICDEVYSVEIVAPLAKSSTSTLGSLGYDNVHVKNADGYFGWEEYAPYDAIIITCAASHIPGPLIKQLADGGRLVLPLGSPHSWQTLTIVEKHGNETTLNYKFPVVFVPMTGEVEKS